MAIPLPNLNLNLNERSDSKGWQGPFVMGSHSVIFGDGNTQSQSSGPVGGANGGADQATGYEGANGSMGGIPLLPVAIGCGLLLLLIILKKRKGK